MATVLIATADSALVDILLRLAAAADVDAVVADDAARARAQWTAAHLLCVGDDLAGELAGFDLPRRPGVVLVQSGDGVDDGLTDGAGDLADPYRRAVDIGAQDVALLPASESWLVDRMATAAEPDHAAATTLCVIGGRGGAGASVVAAVLAAVATRSGLRTFLVDADPLGGGLDLVLGQEGAAGARWPDFTARHGRLSGGALRAAVPDADGLAILSWHRGDTTPIPAAAMRSVLHAAARGSDLVVVDLPRRLDEGTVEALLAADIALVVVPGEVRATVAADQVISAIRRHVDDVRLLVRGPAPGGLSPEVMSESLRVPLAGFVPADRRLATALEAAQESAVTRRGPLPAFCARFLADLALRPSEVIA